jgi:hypothetical protein
VPYASFKCYLLMYFCSKLTSVEIVKYVRKIVSWDETWQSTDYARLLVLYSS